MSFSTGLLECPHDMTADFQARVSVWSKNEGMNQEKARGSFYDLILEAIYCHFHHCLLVKSESTSRGEKGK